jgi:hypothetical protein
MNGTTPASIRSGTHQALLDRFGLFLSYQELAEVLKRDPEGLRLSLSRDSQGWALEINKARVKLGRRVLFSSDGIAAAMDRFTSQSLHQKSSREPLIKARHGRVGG